MAKSVDPDQSAPIGAVCSGSTLFASMLNISNVRQLFAADDFSRRHFRCIFFLALKGLILLHSELHGALIILSANRRPTRISAKIQGLHGDTLHSFYAYDIYCLSYNLIYLPVCVQMGLMSDA